MQVAHTKKLRTSPEIIEITKALNKLQGEIKGAKKDSKNSHFNSKYSDIESNWEAVRELIAKNGLFLAQTEELTEHEEQLVIVSTVLHVSGQWIEGDLRLPISRIDAQGKGSAFTYAKRYAMQGILGIAPIDDDDGNAAVEAKKFDNSRKELEAADKQREYASKAPSKASSSEPVNYELGKRPYAIVDGVENPYKEEGIDWRKVQFHISKFDKTTPLTKVAEERLMNFYRTWKPSPYNGKISDKDWQLDAGLVAWGIEKVTNNPADDDIPF